MKVKQGKTKTRLIHDLRRSGTNSQVRMQERLVLPRMSDCLEDTLDLMDTMDPIIPMDTMDSIIPMDAMGAWTISH